MCQFASFWIHKTHGVLVGNFISHNGVEDGYKVSALDMRECEWTGDGQESLGVRTAADDDHSFWLSLVTSKYATRSELLNRVRNGKIKKVEYVFDGYGKIVVAKIREDLDPNLTELWLRDNQITDLSALSGLMDNGLIVYR